MSRISAINRLVAVIAAGAVAAISLAACGDSSPKAAASTSNAGSSTTTGQVSLSTTTSQTSSPAKSSGTTLQGQDEHEVIYTLIECLRANGVAMPPPNRSGSGPIYNLKGVNTSGATFKHARALCVPKAEASMRAAEAKH